MLVGIRVVKGHIQKLALNHYRLESIQQGPLEMPGQYSGIFATPHNSFDMFCSPQRPRSDRHYRLTTNNLADTKGFQSYTTKSQGRTLPAPVPLAGAGIGALVVLGAAVCCRLGFDQFLQDQFHGAADDVERIPVIQQLAISDRAPLVKGSSWPNPQRKSTTWWDSSPIAWFSGLTPVRMERRLAFNESSCRLRYVWYPGPPIWFQ